MVNLSLEFLTKFVTVFDGSRDKLYPFLRKCEHAFSLATAEQEPILFAYVQSQIIGKADLVISTRDLTTWEDLKDFLVDNFSDTKKFPQLLIELQSCKQLHHENVLAYTQRIEQCYSNLLRAAKSDTTNPLELTGKIAMIKEIALQAFLIGVHPRYNVILRARNPATFEIASEIALDEEKIANFARETNSFSQRVCSICKKPGHSNFNCYKNVHGNIPSHQKTFVKREPMMFNVNSKINCNYCKKPGHLIADCRKREFNNKNKSNNSMNVNKSNRDNIQCYKCKQFGHMIKDCQDKHRIQSNNSHSTQRSIRSSLNSNDSVAAAVPRNLENCQAEYFN